MHKYTDIVGPDGFHGVILDGLLEVSLATFKMESFVIRVLRATENCR